ncbi:MAG: metallophosphoesterase family protein [Bacteroidales bacterium]|nr:metallophosphoesterase family protein [Bacteroidales bacterium]
MKAGIYRTEKDKERRIIWAAMRASLEASRFKYKRNGKKSKSHWTTFERMLGFLRLGLKLTGLYDKGLKNASEMKLEEHTLFFSTLPGAFDGFKILNLSDFHIDSLNNHEDKIIRKVAPLEYDTAFFTGDYRKNISGSFKNILGPMKKIAAAINPPYGKWAVLGNHDSYLMAEYEEEVGINLIVNETFELEKEGQKIYITGTDDPYYYYSEQALFALEKPLEGFKIALVHTSELRDVAAQNDYNLYLCGHTHGGQICLPNGKAILTHQYEGKGFVSGIWDYNGMIGYTNRGCGVSGIPVRFNCPPEITLITLKKK